MPLPVRLGVHHPKLTRAVEIMEANIEEPLRQEALAQRTGLSRRQLERLFRRHLDPHPGPVLPRDPPRARPPPDPPDRPADHEHRLRHRVRLGLALLDLLPADVREDTSCRTGAA